jgi:hypothetical protein
MGCVSCNTAAILNLSRAGANKRAEQLLARFGLRADLDEKKGGYLEESVSGLRARMRQHAVRWKFRRRWPSLTGRGGVQTRPYSCAAIARDLRWLAHDV